MDNSLGRRSDWRGRPGREAALLELHVRHLHPPAGASARRSSELDHFVDSRLHRDRAHAGRGFLRAAGIGAMTACCPSRPIAPMAGRTPQALVDAAHQRGLMVLLDVVYNHFGPEGNYLARYAQAVLRETRSRRHGAPAIDSRRSRSVRAVLLRQRAAIGCSDYRFDGLRFDAVHAIVDDRPAADPGGAQPTRSASSPPIRRRPPHAGKRRQRREPARPRHDPPQGKYRAQWNDDYHHAWHVLLTGERKGYYADYAGTPVRHLRRALAAGFAYQGEVSRHRTAGGVENPPAACRRGLRRLPPEPRPDRQPAVRRSPRRARRRSGARGRACRHLARARCRR